MVHRYRLNIDDLMRGVADPQLGDHLQWHSRARSAPERSPHVGILMKELNAKGNRRSQFLLQRALVNQIVQHIPQVHLDMQDSWSRGDRKLGQTRLWRCSRSRTLCHAWQQGGVPKPGFPNSSREVCGWQDGVIQSWARPGRVHMQCSDASTRRWQFAEKVACGNKACACLCKPALSYMNLHR